MLTDTNWQKRIILYCLSAMLSLSALGGNYQTEVLSQQFASLQVFPEGMPLNMPVIKLNSADRILISFDELIFSKKSFFYKIMHCNADWSVSSLSEMEYIDGINSNRIYNVELSENTIYNYTNYSFSLPNEDVEFKLSGNYVVLIAENANFSNPIATACFYVVEPSVEIDIDISANTVLGINDKYQQVDFRINNANYPISNVFSELKVNVYQNRRNDNAAKGVQPTFTNINQQQYINNRDLIFEGGNQYRVIDFASQYAFGGEIDKIGEQRDYYNVFLTPALPRSNYSVQTTGIDVNGQYLINRKGFDDSYKNADYMWVHFVVPEQLFLSKYNIHLIGNFLNNTIDDNSKLEYDREIGAYTKQCLLKQGAYTFLYTLVPKSGGESSLQQFEGSYWQTDNEYSVFVYHRPLTGRYDKLIGVQTKVYTR